MAENTIVYTIRANDAFSSVAKRINAATKSMDKHVAGLDARMKAFGRRTSGVGRYLSLRLSAPILALGGYAVHAYAKMEKLQTSFSILLRSAAAGKGLIEYLNKFTMGAPFDIQEVASATKTMLSFGMSLQQVKANLSMVGDVAAATGMPMQQLARYLGRISAIGYIPAGALGTMGSYGIPAVKSFAKIIGISQKEVLKLAAAGKITFPIFLSLMGKMTGKGGAFYQMMIKQSETLTGRLSLLHNRIFSISRKLGDLIVTQLKLKEVVSAVSNALQPLYDNFSKLVEKHPLLMKIAIAFGVIGVVLPPILIAIGLFTTLMAALLAPTNLIVAGIIAAGAAAVLLYRKFWMFRMIVKGIGDLINYTIVKPIMFLLDHLHSGTYGHPNRQMVGGLVGGLLGGNNASATMDINLNAPPGVVKSTALSAKGFGSANLSGLGKNMFKGAF